MAEKIPNSQRMLQLREDVVLLREKAPEYILSCMEKEKHLLVQNLKESEFRMDREPSANIEKVKKSYITNSFCEVQKPKDLIGKQMQLNSRVDTLLQCIDYLKK